MLSKMHEPRFVPILFEINVAAGTAHFRVDELVDASSEPIRNPITGDPQRARLVLPQGFEFAEAEFASSTVNTTASPITLQWSGRHAHLARLDITGKGVVRAA
jgi:hypothetical protein